MSNLWDGLANGAEGGNPLLREATRAELMRTAADSDYNGWSNYETWLVVATMDNDQFMYETISQSEHATNAAWLEATWVTYNGTSDPDPAKVDWQEIADSRRSERTGARRKTAAWPDGITVQDISPPAIKGFTPFASVVLLNNEAIGEYRYHSLGEDGGYGPTLEAASYVTGKGMTYSVGENELPSHYVRPAMEWMIEQASAGRTARRKVASGGDTVAIRDLRVGDRVFLHELSKDPGNPGLTGYPDFTVVTVTEVAPFAEDGWVAVKFTGGGGTLLTGLDPDRTVALASSRTARRRVAYQSQGAWYGDHWGIIWHGEYGDGADWYIYADFLMSDEVLEEGRIDGPQSIPRAQAAVAEALARHGLPGDPYNPEPADTIHSVVGSGRRRTAEVYSGPMVKVVNMGAEIKVEVRGGTPPESYDRFTIHNDGVTTAALGLVESALVQRGWRTDTASWHSSQEGVWWANVEQVLPGITGKQRKNKMARKIHAMPQDKLPGLEEYGPPTLSEMIDRLPSALTLAYVDYRDALTEDQLAQLFETGDFSAIDDYEFESMLYGVQSVLDEYFDEDELDSLTPGEQEELRYAIEERNDSDVLGELARNTPDIGMRYHTGASFDLTGLESDAEYEEIFDEIASVLGVSRSSNQAALEELVYNSSGACGLYVAWNEPAEGVIEMGFSNPGTLSWSSPTVLLLDTFNGSGWETTVNGSVSKPFDKSRISLDYIGAPGGYSWSSVIGQDRSFGATRN